MLCKKGVYNGLSLELYTIFDFHLRKKLLVKKIIPKKKF